MLQILITEDDFYVPGFWKRLMLLLRRTLVHPVIYSTF